MFDICRVEKALRDEGKRKQISQSRIQEVINMTSQIVERCGEFSKNRKMATKIGIALMNNCHTVVVPVCVNYSNLKNYAETTRSFLEKHAAFLEMIHSVAPIAPTFLIPKHEATNSMLRYISGYTEKDLIQIFEEISIIVYSTAKEYGQGAQPMDMFFPNVLEREQEMYEVLKNAEGTKQQIEAHTLKRRAIYPESLSVDEMKSLTTKTVAQYITLGDFAAKNNVLICNHTTTSLQWYLKTKAAILHNPISLV